MTLFYTSSVKHLAKKINLHKGKFTIKKFSDGEIYVEVKEKVKNKSVWVLASTNPPGDNLLELLFLLDALKREKAKINLLIPYFGYARQDRRKEGESLSAEVVSNLLKQANKIKIIHVHSPRLKKFLNYDDIIPLKLYYSIITKYDVIVAPDKGSLNLVKRISKKTKIPFALMEKIRPAHEKAVITKIKGKVKNKKAIIIDDMISTGGTVIAASKSLKQAGATEISVIATHGIFAADAIKRIEKSPIKKVYVTNSILQKQHFKNIKVIDLSKFIEDIIKRR